MPSPQKISSLYNAPYLDKGRSRFDLSHTSHFDFYNGLLTPVDSPILTIPGDTFDVSQRSFIRMSQPLKVAPFDSITCDIHYFFVPMRLVWDNWNKFITGDVGTQWDSVSSLTCPTSYLNLDFTGTAGYSNQVHSLLDYMGLPPYGPIYDSTATPDVQTTYINTLPMRAYYLIWNFYYRYEPLFPEVFINHGDTDTTPIDPSKDFIYGVESNKLCPVMKLPDYFTRALPQPTRGPEVALDLSLPESLWSNVDPIGAVINNGGSDTYSSGYYNTIAFTNPSGSSVSSHSIGSLATNVGYLTDEGDIVSNVKTLGFYNLFGGSINGLREAFVLDKIRRIDALFGSRIGSYTKGHYGVTPPEIANQPEYLGGHTFDINVNQVVQTSDTGSGSGELGEIGGYSFTKHEGHYFTKSFTEFGYILGLINTRVKHHTYAQGLSRLFLKRERFDFWLPEMSNMSDEALYTYELYTSDDTYSAYADKRQVFGFVERGWEYKSLPSRVAGLMRPQVNNTLDVWTYTDLYSDIPYLSTDWIIEPKNALDRSLYLDSDTAPTFISHLFFDIKAYRVMPYHSIPGGLTGSW